MFLDGIEQLNPRVEKTRAVVPCAEQWFPYRYRNYEYSGLFSGSHFNKKDWEITGSTGAEHTCRISAVATGVL